MASLGARLRPPGALLEPLSPPSIARWPSPSVGELRARCWPSIICRRLTISPHRSILSPLAARQPPSHLLIARVARCSPRQRSSETDSAHRGELKGPPSESDRPLNRPVDSPARPRRALRMSEPSPPPVATWRRRKHSPAEKAARHRLHRRRPLAIVACCATSPTNSPGGSIIRAGPSRLWPRKQPPVCPGRRHPECEPDRSYPSRGI